MSKIAQQVGVIVLASIWPMLAQSTPFVGQIITVAFNFCPVGWLEADGRLMPVDTNAPLFQLLGSTFGGDGVTTYRLPTAPAEVLADGQLLRSCISTGGIQGAP